MVPEKHNNIFGPNLKIYTGTHLVPLHGTLCKTCETHYDIRNRGHTDSRNHKDDHYIHSRHIYADYVNYPVWTSAAALVHCFYWKVVTPAENLLQTDHCIYKKELYIRFCALFTNDD